MHEPRYETIRPRTRRIGRRIVHLASVPSTMDEARRLAAEGAQDGTIVVADRQTQGRGRNERAWLSPPGSLHATILIASPPPGATLPLLALTVGLSAAHAIEKVARVQALLKWPNDLWIGGQKVGGVLIETRFEGERPVFALVGIGINGDARREDLPEPIQATATSLSIAAGRHVCMPAVLKVLAEDLERRLDGLVAGDTARIVRDASERSAILGHRVRVETAHGSVTGTAQRLGPLGELVVATSTGETKVLAGDCLLLRPEA